jgi:purine nucleoside phosphorylase
MTNVKIGIIGGSGLYQMPELRDIEEVNVDTRSAVLRTPLSLARLKRSA